MLTTILISIGVPVLAGAAYLALRNTRPQFSADVRGIALQTVIIMVVLLAIAGTVAGVLLARSGDVTSELEAQNISAGVIINEATCTAHSMSGQAGNWAAATGCTWTANANGPSPTDVTKSRCDLVRGKYSAGTGTASSGTKATCVKSA